MAVGVESMMPYPQGVTPNDRAADSTYTWMLTKLRINNFKRFAAAEIELGASVVFIGPNNSGKTTALQSLALWETGLRSWNAKRAGRESPKKRPGVTINRRDLVSIPVPRAELLWRELHVREGANGNRGTANVRIDISVDGVTDPSDAVSGSRTRWTCGLEFDFSNPESLYCRPLRRPGSENRPVNASEFSEIPEAAAQVRVAYLPPMSGIADREFRKERGEIDFLLGQGQTAQVLRNLCYRIYANENSNSDGDWDDLVNRVHDLFGIQLRPPEYVAERSEITMEYEEGRTRLDLACSGRGLQQTLLLLAHLYANPKTVLLLDEPDAHLEVLRQRQTYQMLVDVATRQGCQIVAASHSEVVLNEAADKDVVVAFVGQPHRIDDRGSQVLKSLKEIGFDQYYQAEQTGWVLYLEGSTDLAILQAFARKLRHPVAAHLERPFVFYVGNEAGRVRSHFFGLREAKPDLVGVAVFDRLPRELPGDLGAVGLVWSRREIENYLCNPQVLRAFAISEAGDATLLSGVYANRMDRLIADYVPPVALRDVNNAWWSNTKVTDDFLDPLFERFYEEEGIPNLMRKSDYHRLADFIVPNEIPPEVTEKLDRIRQTAEQARPRQD